MKKSSKLGLVMGVLVLLMAAMSVNAGEGLRSTIYSSTTNTTASIANPFGVRVSLCYVSVIGDLESAPVLIRQTANSGAITNILAYDATVSNTLSWVEGGKAIAWATGERLLFTIGATNVTAKKIIIQCKED